MFMRFLAYIGAALVSTSFTVTAMGQEIPTPKLEYLMTYEAELELPQVINDSLYIYTCLPGGWARGPGINGFFTGGPCDWLRIMPSGVARLDVRATLKTDDGELIYITYNGIIKHSEKSYEKLVNGARITPEDGIYFITAPTFETTSEKYAWLNSVQAVGKMVEVQVSSERSYVRYDIYVVR
jgi:hypothetical protein